MDQAGKNEDVKSGAISKESVKGLVDCRWEVRGKDEQRVGKATRAMKLFSEIKNGVGGIHS